MKRLGLVLVMLLLAFGVQAQDSITPNTSQVQINSTVVTGPSKVMTYAKFIGYGNPTDAQMESVHSVLTRLIASSSAQGATNISLEFSVDGTTWRTTYNSATDAYYRFRVGLGTWSASIPIGSTSGGAGAGVSSLSSTDGSIVVSQSTGHVVVSVSPGVVVAWANITDKPDMAIRWPRASEVIGLDAHLQGYFEKTGLLGPQAPVVHWIGRQWLRRGSAYRLDLQEYIFDATSFTVANLPSGLTLSPNSSIISGTPDTEQEQWVVITATNADGSTAFTIPFIVLRDVMFTTVRQGFTGLTTKDDVQIAAMLSSASPQIYRWNKLGVAATADTVTLDTTRSGANPVGSTGLAWTTAYWAVLGNVSGTPPLVQDIIRFNLGGSPPAALLVSSDTAVRGSRGIAYENNHLYTIAMAGSIPNVTKFASGTLVKDASFGGSRPTNPLMTDPQGIAIRGGQMYIVDDAADKVFVFDMSDGGTGAGTLFREWTLHADNHDPRGITYLDDYWYVSEQGQGAKNDDVYIYPTKEMSDPTVPELLSLETTTHGVFSTGEIIRVRATFSGPVDISSDVRLHLLVGPNQRDAHPVSGTTGTQAQAQSDTNVGYFAYTVVAADDDADGITTPAHPFSTGGRIVPADDERDANEFSLNAGDSRYRVTAPPGLAGLHPNPKTRVNANTQPDWAQTDASADDYIQNKPTELIAYPNTASLARFVWTPEMDIGIEYTTERGTAYNQLTLATMAGWQTWDETKSFVSGDTLLLRVHDTAVVNLAKAYARGIGYEQNLGHINSDGDAWHRYNTSPDSGYYYYAFTTTMTASGTAGTAYRELPYDALSGAPEIPGPQVQPDWDATSGLAVILNKPDIEKYQTGQDANIANIIRASSRTIRVTPSAAIRSEAEAHGTKPHLSVAVHWKTADTPSALAEAQGRISVEEEPATRDDYEGEFHVLPRGTYTVTKASVDMEPGDTSYLIELERDGEDPDPSPDIVVQKLVWRISLADTGSALTAGNGITIANGEIAIANGGVDTGQLADDGVTLDKLDLSGDPVAGQAFYFSGNGLEGGYRFLPEEPTSNSGLRMALTTGTPTLPQLQALSYNADIEASAQQRVGQIVVVRIASGTDIAGHVLVIGEPSASPNGDTALRMLLSELTSVGTASGFTYRRTSGLTVPATAEIDFYLMSAYAAEQVKDLYVYGGGTAGGGTITGVTASPPLTATGTTTRNIVIDNNGITPDLLQADTETEKSAMRTRLGITSGGSSTPAANSITPAMLQAVTAQQKEALRTRIGAGTGDGNASYVSSATHAVHNINLTTGGTNPKTGPVENVTDLTAFASNFQLGYGGWTLEFSGTIGLTGTTGQTGTADLYFQPTGSTRKYYLFQDYATTSALKEPTGSVEIEGTVVSGGLYLVRKTGTTNVELSGTLTARDPVDVPEFTDHLNWNPTWVRKEGYISAQSSVVLQAGRYNRWGNLVYYFGNIRMRRNSGVATNKWHGTFALPYLPTGATVRNYQCGTIAANYPTQHYQAFTNANRLEVNLLPLDSETDSDAHTVYATITGWYLIEP